MKKLLLSAALCALLSSTAVADNMAINLPTPTSGIRQAARLTVDETVLGITRGSGSNWINVERSFTMAAWIKVNGKSTLFGGQALMGHQAQDHVNYNGSFFLSIPSNATAFTLTGKTGSGAVTYNETSSTEYTTGDWHYYTMVYDADALTMTLYVDGESTAVKTFSSYAQLFPDNPGVLFFGNVTSHTTVDDAQIFSKALTQDEVKTAMSDPQAVGDLDCYYTFDEVLDGTTGQFENHGSLKDVKAMYLIGSGSADGSGVISCGSNHTESAPELVESRSTVGIDGINADLTEEDPSSVRFYNLQGMEVSSDNLTSGLYIRKSNTKVQKVLVK